MADEDPIRVMIVDDHAVVRSGLSAFLMAFDDLEFVGDASGGAEAVRKCRELRPQVVLMDLVMPEMDGAEATRQIREVCPDIQVIALTSYKDENLVEGALKAGCHQLPPQERVGRRAGGSDQRSASWPFDSCPRGGPSADQGRHDRPRQRRGPDQEGTRDPEAHGGRVQQPPDRQEAFHKPVDGEVPCQQHPDEAWSKYPDRGRGVGASASAGGMTGEGDRRSYVSKGPAALPAPELLPSRTPSRPGCRPRARAAAEGNPAEAIPQRAARCSWSIKIGGRSGSRPWRSASWPSSRRSTPR